LAAVAEALDLQDHSTAVEAHRAAQRILGLAVV